MTNQHRPAALMLLPLVVEPGAEATFEATPLKDPFRADYFIIERPEPFVILDITVAGTSQVRLRGTGAEGGEHLGLLPPRHDFIPAISFGHFDPVARLRFDVCAAGACMVVKIRNVSLEPAEFKAKFIGYELTGKGESTMGKNEPTLAPVTVTISGKHDTGRSTLANLIKMALEENEYRHVTLQDVKPLSSDEKDRFSERFERNRYLRAVNIRVVTEE